MFTSRCEDHDHCWLDLELLRADLKEMAVAQRELNAKRKVAKPEDPYISPQVGPKRLAEAGLWLLHNRAQTLLYALRAAHRGRVHRKRERLHDAKDHVVTYNYADQTALLEKYSAWIRMAYSNKVAAQVPPA